MFEVIKYRWKLYELNKQYENVTEKYKQLKKDVKGDEYAMLHTEEGSEVVPLLEEMDALKTRRFCQIADNLMVPLPDSKDESLWSDRYYGKGKNLTINGIWELKKFIRQEKRERREGFMVWLAALTGIIGIITGLVAVVLR